MTFLQNVFIFWFDCIRWAYYALKSERVKIYKKKKNRQEIYELLISLSAKFFFSVMVAFNLRKLKFNDCTAVRVNWQPTGDGEREREKKTVMCKLSSNDVSNQFWSRDETPVHSHTFLTRLFAEADTTHRKTMGHFS